MSYCASGGFRKHIEKQRKWARAVVHDFPATEAFQTAPLQIVAPRHFCSNAHSVQTTCEAFRLWLRFAIDANLLIAYYLRPIHVLANKFLALANGKT